MDEARRAACEDVAATMLRLADALGPDAVTALAIALGVLCRARRVAPADAMALVVAGYSAARDGEVRA